MQSEAKTTQEMVACYGKGLAMWDKELNRYYKRLTAELSPEQQQALQTAQREWLQYRDAERPPLTPWIMTEPCRGFLAPRKQ
jgi:uncharacterized protein YecT (DUF1311 family)